MHPDAPTYTDAPTRDRLSEKRVSGFIPRYLTPPRPGPPRRAPRTCTAATSAGAMDLPISSCRFFCTRKVAMAPSRQPTCSRDQEGAGAAAGAGAGVRIRGIRGMGAQAGRPTR